MEDCGLHDLEFEGLIYTWNNKRPDCGNVRGRLNRALGSASWKLKFMNAKVVHLDACASDHVPI